MPSLLDLTSQGDVGTIADESKLASVTLMTPQQLYELWERQHWASHTIDFEQDKRDWQEMDPDLREHLSWNLSSFFIGEERVTTQFSGLVMSYESQGEEAFLTTQLQNWVGIGTNLTNVTAQNGLAQNEVTATQSALTSRQTMLTNLIGNIDQTDVAQATTNLQQAQLSIQAAGQVFQALNASSLLNTLTATQA